MLSMELEKQVVLGVIGGSGMDQMPGFIPVKSHEMETPYGRPSDSILETKIEGRSVFFLPRHGAGHVLSPSEVPYRANIAAFKKLGVTHLLAISAVGIMKEQIHPGDLILPDQIIDWTKGKRCSSFFEEGFVGHLMFAEPFCPVMREYTFQAAKAHSEQIHRDGTYLCIEGPRFSSRAESQFFRRTMTPSCIGMTAHPEAALAKELGIATSQLSLATDYDCWREGGDDVCVDAILTVLKKNSTRAQSIVIELTKILPLNFRPQPSNLKDMLITRAEKITTHAQQRLDYLFG